MVYQLGIAPNRIDVVTGITGVTFPTAWKNRVRTRYGRQRVSLLGLRELRRNKKSAGRKQDMLDLEILAKAQRKRPRRR